MRRRHRAEIDEERVLTEEWQQKHGRLVKLHEEALTSHQSLLMQKEESFRKALASANAAAAAAVEEARRMARIEAVEPGAERLLEETNAKHKREIEEKEAKHKKAIAKREEVTRDQKKHHKMQLQLLRSQHRHQILASAGKDESASADMKQEDLFWHEKYVNLLEKQSSERVSHQIALLEEQEKLPRELAEKELQFQEVQESIVRQHKAEVEALTEKFQKTREDALEKLAAKHAEELESCKSRIQEWQKEYDAMAKESDAALKGSRDALSREQEAHASEMARQVEASSLALTEIRAANATELSEQADVLRDAHNKELRELAESNKAALEATLEKVRFWRTKYDEAVNKYRAADNSKRALLVENSQKRTMRMLEQERLHVNAMTQLKHEHLDELRDIAEQHVSEKNAALADLAAKHTKELKDREAQIEKWRALHAEAVEDLKDEQDTRRESLATLRRDQQSALLQKEKSYRKALAELGKLKRADAAPLLGKLREKHRVAMIELRAQHSKDLERVEAAFAKVQSEHVASIASQCTSASTEAKMLEEMHLEYSAALREQEQAHAKELHQIRAGHEVEKAKMRFKHIAACEMAMKKTTARHMSEMASHEAQIAILRKKHADCIEEHQRAVNDLCLAMAAQKDDHASATGEIMKEKGLRAEDPFDEVIAESEVVDLIPGKSFEDAIIKASALLSTKIKTLNKNEVCNQLLEGTRIGATPVTGGVALPHLRLDHIENPYMVIIRSLHGINPPNYVENTKEQENKKISAIFVLLSPENNPALHLRLLAQLAGSVEREDFLPMWADARSAQEIREVLLRNERFVSLVLLENTPTEALINHDLRSPLLPENTLVVMIRRRSKMIVPKGNTTLKQGDRITILGEPKAIQTIRNQFEVREQ